jgi:hypothetical protein
MDSENGVEDGSVFTDRGSDPLVMRYAGVMKFPDPTGFRVS